jgi:hypothetical protein
VDFKRFDRGNCNKEGHFVPKSKKKERQGRRNPAVPRTNFSIKFASAGNLEYLGTTEKESPYSSNPEHLRNHIKKRRLF